MKYIWLNSYHYTYNANPLKVEVERIYDIFKGLSATEKEKVKTAFTTNNNIESLCDGTAPIYLADLPDVVKHDIKPLFKWCYETLLEKGKVAGDKMDYYNQLIAENGFDTCPCCGLIDFESAESICREAYDHYLPKSKYPFASVNFSNLVPLCYKYNSDRKKAKDPIENDRTVFYPFSTGDHSIEINLNYTADIDAETKKLTFSDLEIKLTGDTDKIQTWDWLFHIKERYEDYLKSKLQAWLREIANRYARNIKRANGLSYSEILDDHIEDYENNKYSEKKFLKIAFLNAVKNDANLMVVYE